MASLDFGTLKGESMDREVNTRTENESFGAGDTYKV